MKVRIPHEVLWMWKLNEEARPEWKRKVLEWLSRNGIELKF